MKFVARERRSSAGAGFEPMRGCSWVDTQGNSLRARRGHSLASCMLMLDARFDPFLQDIRTSAGMSGRNSVKTDISERSRRFMQYAG